MDADEHRYDHITERIIGCAFRVANTLGAGFLEKVYENALGIELRRAGLQAQQQRELRVYYEGQTVGEYVADLVVEDVVLVELKAARALDEIHKAQCLNYLKASGLRICLLINFGTPRIEVQRIVQGL